MRFNRTQYEAAIAALNAGKNQREPDGKPCAICGDGGHQAWECGHNPLLAMATCEEIAEKSEALHEMLHKLAGYDIRMGESVGPAKIVVPVR